MAASNVDLKLDQIASRGYSNICLFLNASNPGNLKVPFPVCERVHDEPGA